MKVFDPGDTCCFFSNIKALNKHSCVDNPDSVSGQPIPIEKRIGALLYNHFFLLSGQKYFN